MAVVSENLVLQEDVRYATLGQRFWALLIDFCVFCVLFFPITRLVKGVWLMSPSDHRWVYGLFITDPLCLVFLVVMFLYFVLLEGWFGATLGKWALGLRVIDQNGKKPGLAKSTTRNVLRLIDGLPAFSLLGIILILRSADRTRLGDRVAKTWVICMRMAA
ncbi:MAG: RDD family protein [Anaerolineae bacterium]|nr:RDD family protein [Anaerolineae bacterium]